jgi:hypothetical protein
MYGVCDYLESVIMWAVLVWVAALVVELCLYGSDVLWERLKRASPYSFGYPVQVGVMACVYLLGDAGKGGRCRRRRTSLSFDDDSSDVEEDVPETPAPAISIQRLLYASAKLIKGVMIALYCLADPPFLDSLQATLVAETPMAPDVLDDVQQFMLVFCTMDAFQLLGGVFMSRGALMRHAVTTCAGLSMALNPAAMMDHVFGRMMLYYAVCSMPACMVDVYLGCRVFFPEKLPLQIIRTLASVLHVCKLVLTLAMDATLLFLALPTVHAGSIGLTLLLLYDDIGLHGHLWNKNRLPMPPA